MLLDVTRLDPSHSFVLCVDRVTSTRLLTKSAEVRVECVCQQPRGRALNKIQMNTYTAIARRVREGFGFHAMLCTAPLHCKVLRHRPVHTSQNLITLSSPPSVNQNNEEKKRNFNSTHQDESNTTRKLSR